MKPTIREWLVVSVLDRLTERWKRAAPIYANLLCQYRHVVTEQELWHLVNELEDQGFLVSRDVKDAEGIRRQELRRPTRRST